jgi:hypothetical protein
MRARRWAWSCKWSACLWKSAGFHTWASSPRLLQRVMTRQVWPRLVQSLFFFNGNFDACAARAFAIRQITANTKITQRNNDGQIENEATSAAENNVDATIQLWAADYIK